MKRRVDLSALLIIFLVVDAPNQNLRSKLHLESATPAATANFIRYADPGFLPKLVKEIDKAYYLGNWDIFLKDK